MSAARINWEALPKIPEQNTPNLSETSSHNGMLVDVNRLIFLTERHPVTRKPIDTFLGRLQVDCWADGHRDDTDRETVTPRMVIDAIKEFGYEGAIQKYPKLERHIQKIQTADYSFPIHVHDNWLINGTHRLSKLVLEREMGKTQQDFITVKNLKEIPKEALMSNDVSK